MLRRAVERGVTLIDTADNYGPSIAEELVAEALHPYPAGLLIATKGGVVRTGDSAWHIAGRPEQLRAMCEASLRRLRLDTIGLYQLHRLDPDVPMAEQLGALDELRARGQDPAHRAGHGHRRTARSGTGVDRTSRPSRTATTCSTAPRSRC